MNYWIFGSVWLGLSLLTFVAIGWASSLHQKEPDSNASAYEITALLGVIVFLLAGILAALIAR